VRDSGAPGNRPPPVPGMVELDPDELAEG
jgi:hypothetical protein